MYERFTVYIDHDPLHWLFTIKDSSGRLIWWRLRLAAFDFDVQYKKGKSNTQAVALLRLNTFRKTIRHDDSDWFLVSLLDSVKRELERNRTLDKVEFIEVHYSQEEELFTKLDDPHPNHPQLEPIGINELLQVQPDD